MRRVTFWAAVGGMSLLSLTVLHVAADRLPIEGLSEFRDYLVRPKG